MTSERVAQLRAQAAHARRLAEEMYNRDAQAEMRQIADALDAQADGLERGEATNPKSPLSDPSS